MMRHIAAAIVPMMALSVLLLAFLLSWRGYAVKRAYRRLADALFAIACRVLLPISTICKVCNILRGMTIGFLLGVGAGALLTGVLLHLVGSI